MKKYKVIIEDPEKGDRQSLILTGDQHSDLLSDLSSAKHGEPIDFPGYGTLPKSAYKGSKLTGVRQAESFKFIHSHGHKVYRAELAFFDGTDIHYKTVRTCDEKEWEEKTKPQQKLWLSECMPRYEAMVEEMRKK